MAVRKYLGQGIKFPHSIDQFGKIEYQNDSELVKQSLRVLFAEPIGTELMREHYGSQIRKGLFQQNDIIVRNLLDYFITDAIQKWERRIMLADIKYKQPNDQPDVIMCTIFFLIKQSSEIDSFIFPFYKELKN